MYSFVLRNLFWVCLTSMLLAAHMQASILTQAVLALAFGLSLTIRESLYSEKAYLKGVESGYLQGQITASLKVLEVIKEHEQRDRNSTQSDSSDRTSEG